MEGQKTFHFIDNVSADLKAALSSHGLLSDAAWRQSLLNKLKLPEYIRQQLLPLNGLCTYELLEDIRYGGTRVADWDGEEVPGDTEGWFSRLRETTSEWSTRPQDPDRVRCENLAREGMLSHQWVCMGEELLSLDKAIRVPRDAPEIQRIYQSIRSIPEYLRDVLFNKHAIKTEIIDIGSFASDLKIIDCNEFDFLLLSNSSVRISDIFIVLQTELTIEENNFLKGVDTVSFFNHEPHISECYPHGPAVCVELGWVCNNKHFHTIGIDVTPARFSGGQNFFLVEGSDTKALLDRFLPPSTLHQTHAAIVGEKYSFAALDKELFSSIRRTFPNSLAVLRILKVFSSYLFPKLGCPVLPEKRDNVKLKGQIEIQPIISSHQLKKAMLQILTRNAHPNAWNVEHLTQRVTEVLQILKTNVSNFGQEDFYSPCDFRNELCKMYEARTMKCVLRSKALIEVYEKIDSLMELINTKQSGNHHHERIKTKFDLPTNTALLAHINGKYHPILKRVTSTMIFLTTTAYSLYSIHKDDMLFDTHPLVSWMKNYMQDLYIRNPGTTIEKKSQITFLPLMRSNSSIKEDSEKVMLSFHALIEQICDDNFDGCDSVHALHTICSYTDFKHMIQVYVDEFPGEYSDPFPRIAELWPLLSQQEKSLVKKIIEEDSKANLLVPRKDGLIEKALHMSSQFSKWQHFINLAQSIAYADCVLARSDLTFLVSNKAKLLTFTCLSYILEHDKEYFIKISMSDMLQAEQSFSEDFEAQSKQRSWEVIKTQPGQDSLYRCILCLQHKVYRDAERLSTGQVVEPGIYAQDLYYIPRMKQLFLKWFTEHSKWDQTALYSSKIREQNALIASEIPDSFILKTASEKCKRPIHVYTEKREESRLIEPKIIGSEYGVDDKEPVCLLHSIDSNSVSHYDVIVFRGICYEQVNFSDLFNDEMIT